MLKVGIDSIAFYSSQYYLDLEDLAVKRGIRQDKFAKSLGQKKMAVPPPDEDVITMAANAAFEAIKDIDTSAIEILLFATESGIDQSKAGGIYIHDLLGLPERCRVVELKQACYSATMALQLAIPFIKENPDKKVLLVASDIARYGIESTGESSQGAGSVAMVLSNNPRLIAFDKEYGVVTANVMDFWRPNYTDEAFVEGKYSSKLYLQMLEKAWQQYTTLSSREFKDHDYYCYHMPVPRLVETAHQHLAKVSGSKETNKDFLQKTISPALSYGREIGNSYSASLYVGLASLFDFADDDMTNKRIGFYSYGSGCVAEYFSGTVQPEYKKALKTQSHKAMLEKRKKLSYEEYEKFYKFNYPEDGKSLEIPKHDTGVFRLAAIRDHQRIYEKVV